MVENYNEKHGTRRKRRNSAGRIPVDLMIEVFARLPAKSLMKFKCLSKQYSSIFGSRNFAGSFFSYSSNKPRVLFSLTIAEELVLYSATTHTDEPSPWVTSTIASRVTVPGHYLSITTPPVRGIICYTIKPNQHVICNPSTRQLLHLPQNEIWKEREFDEYLLFGYEPVSDRFKVISILTASQNNNNIQQQFWISTVGDGNSDWRKIPLDIPYHYRPVLETPLGICINGVLYYKVHTQYQGGGDKKVVSFDLNSEKFSCVNFPREALEITTLIELRGKLAFVDRVEGIRIWILENAEWSSKKYDMPHGILGWSSWSEFDQLSVAGISEGEIVFVPAKRVYPGVLFTCHFNLEKKTRRKVEIELTVDNDYGTYVDYYFANHIENVVTL